MTTDSEGHLMQNRAKVFFIPVSDGEGRAEMAAKAVKLSSVSKGLGEKIKLIKTENRLSRNLSEEDMTRRLNERIEERGADRRLDRVLRGVEQRPGKNRILRTCPLYTRTESHTQGSWLMALLFCRT